MGKIAKPDGLTPHGAAAKLYDELHDLHERAGLPSTRELGRRLDLTATRVYNVIDIRQAYLQKIVREGLRLLGHEGEAERSIHFSYEMVALTPATAVALGMTVNADQSEKNFLEMSGRKGLGVKADDLLDALEAKALEAVQSGAEGSEESQSGSEDLAHQIAVGALRYFMLKFGRNKVIAFDFNEALTFEGDSGPYLQYSTVRVETSFGSSPKEMSMRCSTVLRSIYSPSAAPWMMSCGRSCE